MGRLSGTILILAGVTLAASTLSSRPETPAQAVVAPPPGGQIEAAARPADPAKGGARQVDTTPPPTTTPPQPPAPVLAAPPEPKPHQGGKFIPLQPAVRIAEAPPRVPVDQHKAEHAPPLDTAALTREIQRHLRRIGCYYGPVSGVWSPSVRQAMKTLTDRINTTLPVDQPDPVLLAMVRGQKGAACSASCPAGQTLARDGRCLPDALVARAGKQPNRQPQPGPAPAKGPDDGSTPTPGPAKVAAPPAVRASPTEGRMSLAGPPPAAHVKTPAAAPPGKRAKSARPPRYAEDRFRERRRDERAYYGPRSYDPGYGFPWWAMRAFSQ